MLQLAILYMLGLLGWFVGKVVHIPNPPLLGSIFFLALLRVLEVPIPFPPAILNIFVQILLGLYVGSRITRDTVKTVRDMPIPVLIVVTWALGIAFGFGWFISKVTNLDIYTATLGSSMSGIAEMGIIAVATGADAIVVLVLQTMRSMATVTVFPVLLNYFGRKRDSSSLAVQKSRAAAGLHKQIEFSSTVCTSFCRNLWRSVNSKIALQGNFLELTLRVLVTAALAFLAAFMGEYFHIPAGALVLSALFMIIASLAGLPVIYMPNNLLRFVLVAVAITVTGSVTPETLTVITSGGIFIPLVISVLFTFLSSFVIMFILRRITGWNWETCFLSAAPAGMVVMCAIAVETNNDPVKVSLMHFCRIVALKMLLPVLFLVFY